MAEKEDSKMRQIADSAIMLLTSRISGPLLLGVCSYIALSVVNMKSDVSALTAEVHSNISNLNSHVSELETRFDNIEASYFGGGNANRSHN